MRFSRVSLIAVFAVAIAGCVHNSNSVADHRSTPAPATQAAPGVSNAQGHTSDSALAETIVPDSQVVPDSQLTAKPATTVSAAPVSISGPPVETGDGPKGPVFGSSGNAHSIVFLCDATGSMINKMATLKDELNKTVVGLKPIESFDIIFFQDVKVEPFMPAPVAATPENKRKAGTYLESITATGTTEPIPALVKALQLKPDLLYFLTDAADFPEPDKLVEVINKYNPDRKIKINTILFVENKAEHDKNADSQGLMQQIARDNGGRFRWVEVDNIP